MAAKSEGDKNGCTFQWKIQNMSRCWLKEGERIESPAFVADALGSTKWSLWLYPKGHHHKDFVSFFLHREKDCSGPSEVTVSFTLAYLGKDGSILEEETYSEQGIVKDQILGSKADESRERLFVTEREAFLPEDTLTLQCTMWNTDERPVLTQQYFARTVFKVKRRPFDLRIDEFSTRKSGLTNNFKDEMIDFGLVLYDGVGDDKELAIHIKSFDESVKYVSFKTSIVNNEGKIQSLGAYRYLTDHLKVGVLCTWPLKQGWMKNKRYLQNDVLSLDFEYVCSNILHEFCGGGMIIPKLTNEAVKSENKPYIEKKESLVLLNDLKVMYSDGICSDTELRTSTQNFPAHKNILSARSPVFRKMFSHDMKEKNCGHVDITDTDDETVQQMLLYMYTDSLEDMYFEGALKLYSIADKYEMSSLKSRCFSFLKYNLCPTNACQALVQSDHHHNVDMKNYVQDYMLQQDKAFFDTQEWTDLMNTHLKLAADIMHKKIKL